MEDRVVLIPITRSDRELRRDDRSKAQDSKKSKSLKRKKMQKRQKRIHRLKVTLIVLILFFVCRSGLKYIEATYTAAVHLSPRELSACPDWLKEMVKRNPETASFAKDYVNREDYIGKPIDLSGECRQGEVPMLFQWDKRWGYDAYGNDAIGAAGCGPTCLSMAYIYLTGDTSKDPRVMAEYAYENGYYTAEGTAWSLWTEGAGGLGLLSGEVLLDEDTMKNRLDAGGVIICSMRPGDFTTTGHFILIYGYNEEGFQVRDPNRRSNTEKTWPFEVLQGQIKCLWSLSY